MLKTIIQPSIRSVHGRAVLVSACEAVMETTDVDAVLLLFLMLQRFLYGGSDWLKIEKR